MTTAGDKVVDNMLKQAEDLLEKPSVNTVCKDHDVLRAGVYALVLDAQERRSDKVTDKNDAEWKLLGGKLLSYKGKDIPAREIALIAVVVGIILLYADKFIGILEKIAQ